MKDTLYLPLKKEWYRMIESGAKTEEYREVKNHYLKKLCFHKQTTGDPTCVGDDCEECYRIAFEVEGDFQYVCYPYECVRFSYGYTRRTMTYEVKQIRIGYGKPEWGAPADKEVFIIELGRRVQ